MLDSENAESLRVNGALVTDIEDMRRVVKEFWEETGGVGEVSEVREGCISTFIPQIHLSFFSFIIHSFHPNLILEC